jgi:archaeal flagellar protein FlaJ
MSRSQYAEYLIDLSYSLFGRLVPRLPSLKSEFNKSGIKLNFEVYITFAILVYTIVGGLAFSIVFLIQSTFSIQLAQSLLGAVLLAFVSSTLALTILIAYPLIRVSRIKKEIDSNLVYTVGYMNVLSAGGLSIERMFERIVEVESNSAIRNLAIRFTSNVKIFGADIVASLNDLQAHSASEVFSKLLVSITSTSKNCGDLNNLLAFETNHLFALKREQLKKRLSSMIALSEVYITAMVMAPVAFIIMITLLSVLGNSSFGISPIAQLNLIVFFGIPFLSVLFIIILDGVLPKED